MRASAGATGGKGRKLAGRADGRQAPREDESAATPGRGHGLAATQSRPRLPHKRRSRHGDVAGTSPLEKGAGDEWAKAGRLRRGEKLFPAKEKPETQKCIDLHSQICEHEQ